MEECQKFTYKYWEKVKYSKPQLSKFKKFVSRSVSGELQLTQISLNFQTSCYNLKIRGLGANLWVDFLVFFFLEGIMTLKSPCFLLNKNINFNKNETKSKMESAAHRWTLCFSSYKNCELKAKLWSVAARERKNSAFFVTFILSEWNFCNICVLNKLSEYIYFYILKKHYFIHFCCLFLKLLKVFSVSLKTYCRIYFHLIKMLMLLIDLSVKGADLYLIF